MTQDGMILNGMSAEERTTLAGEYALGVLDSDAMARCEQFATTDRAFAAAVEEWRGRLAEIDLSAIPQTPGEGLWHRIEASVAARPRTSRVQSATPAPNWLAVFWESLPLWRGVGMAAATAMVLLAIGLGVQSQRAARTPALVAVLITDQAKPAAIVNAFHDGRVELIPLEAIVAPEGRSLQVWTLWDRARGPVSVGLLDAMRSLDLRLDGLPETAPEQLFEVTLEPAGGSPTGRPTGPILMKGTTSLAL